MVAGLLNLFDIFVKRFCKQNVSIKNEYYLLAKPCIHVECGSVSVTIL